MLKPKRVRFSWLTSLPVAILAVYATWFAGSVCVYYVLARLRPEFLASPDSEGLARIVSGLLGLAAIALFARSSDTSPKASMGLVPMRIETVPLLLLAAAILLMTVHNGYIYLRLGEPYVDPSVREYLLAGHFPYLEWLSLVAVAPLFEEMFTRGLIFGRLENTRVGVPGAVFISSLVFVAFHQNADRVEMVQLFVWGIALGVARWKTGSVYAPLVMHTFWNLVLAVSAFLFFIRL